MKARLSKILPCYGLMAKEIHIKPSFKIVGHSRQTGRQVPILGDDPLKFWGTDTKSLDL